MVKCLRFRYLLITLLVIVLGLLSRRINVSGGEWVRLYAGDVLWAMMVYFGCRFVWVKAGRGVSCAVALIFSYCIEISQLYHAPWIDAVRATTLGGLVLGFGFLWSDLVCYTVGVILGVLIDVVVDRGERCKYF